MKILVIEDEYKLGRALEKGLRLAGNTVDVCHDSGTGRSRALHGSYDVIVLDRMLPGGFDGIHIIKEMRQEGLPTPVIMLTAKDSISDRVDGLDAGADDYLVKPFAFEELLARIRTITRPKLGSRRSDELQHGDIVMNLKSKTASFAGIEASLTAKEFMLLEFFYEARGRNS